MVKLMGVVSNEPYTFNESVNLRGYPAVHAIREDRPERTLCGKNPTNWSYLDVYVSDINCKVCLKVMSKLEKVMEA